jgi:steroid 5-alpha reductase family enzyme
MHRATIQSFLAIPLVLAAAAFIAWAGSRGSVIALGMPLFALCALISFALNWAAFLPSYVFQTERYFDLTGSLTYLTLVACALGLGGAPDPRALLLGALVAAWAIRLGSFLFARIRREGSDPRFDALKPDFARFLLVWTLQGLWAFLTLSCALAAITSVARAPLGWLAAAGTGLWILGFSIEVVADRQKRRFRADPENRDRFIATGLWAWSRHPNYFGEITLWIGIALVALPTLAGWQLATLISPVFVFVLLTRVSGIPLLESRAQEKWGHDPDYQAYRARTPVLLMRPPASS